MPLPEISDSLYVRKRGGGWFALFGLPFFIAGLVIIGFGFIPQEVRGGDEFPLLVALPFGGIFVAVGAALMFGRSSTEIDKEAGIVRQWWGLLRPMWKKEFELRDLDRVSLRREVRRSDKSTYTVYPVRLRGGDAIEIKLSEERQFKKGRTDAEELAKFLLLPIHDETSGELRIREPDTLDTSIRDRFQEGRESNEIPETPVDLKSDIHYDGSTLQVATKAIGLTPAIGIVIAVLVIGEIVFFGIAGKFFLDDASNLPIPLLLVILAFAVGIPALILLAVVGKAFFARDEIEASSQELSITRHFLGMRKTTTIPASELEELFITGSPAAGKGTIALGRHAAICARSDRADITFARGLSQEELAYLLALAKAAIVS